MHSIEKIKEIQRLLADGEISQRQIAKKLRVARGTVNAIANGTRGSHGREMNRAKTGKLTSSDWLTDLPQAKCPECGVVGYVPCIACEARAFRRRQLTGGQRAA